MQSTRRLVSHRLFKLLQNNHVRTQHSQTPTSVSHPSPPHLQRPFSQPTYLTHPHLLDASYITPQISRDEYVLRRHNLAHALPPNSVSVFPSNPQLYMTEDVPYLYHPDTDLTYISAVAEPSAFLVAYRPALPEETIYTLFVSQRDPARELWDGPSLGPSDDVRQYFALDHVRPVSDFPSFLADVVPRLDSFHFDASVNPQISRQLTALDATHQNALLQRWARDKPPKTFLLPLRLVKSPAEIDLLRKAAQAVATAFNEAIAAFRAVPVESSAQTHTAHPHVTERDIEAVIQYECLRRGANRMAFPSVVAAGTNATVLHYMRNDARAVAGDFVMVDAGCELHGYCSDVSRSWPISGTFSTPQRELYQLVLETQRKAIDMAVQGCVVEGAIVTLDRMHMVAARELTDGLLQLGFLSGHSLESALATGAYAKYFSHATGHYLGMDVHDTHLLPKNLPLKKGMVITVEPGLYCPMDDESAPKAFRGIGMRIEDDVVVSDGHEPPEVLSKDAVKSVADIEQLVGSRPR